MPTAFMVADSRHQRNRGRSGSDSGRLPSRLSTSLYHLLLLLAFALVMTTPVSAAAVTLKAWVSGSATMYKIMLTSHQSGLTTALTNDYNDALETAATNAGISPAPTVTTLTPMDMSTETPAYGLMTSYVVADGDGASALGEGAIRDAIAAASLSRLNAFLSLSLGSDATSVKVLPVSDPADTRAVLVEEPLGISGAAFLWYVVFDMAGLSNEQTTLIQLPLASDLQNIADPDLSNYIVEVSDSLVNASGYYTVCSVYEMLVPTQARSVTPLLSELLDQDLPLYTASVDAVFGANAQLAAYRNILPNPLRTTRHLPADPTADDDSNNGASFTVLDTVSSSARMYFAGTEQGWSGVLSSPTHDTFSAELVSLLSATFNRSGFVNKVSLTDIYTRYDKEAKVEGLYVVVSVEQGETALAKHTYTSEEARSVIDNSANYTSLYAYYTGATQPASEALTGVAIPSFVAVGSNGDFGLQCTTGCVGMIIMSAIAVFLMLVIFLIFIIVVCCCYCGPAEKQTDKKGSSGSNQARSGTTAYRDVDVLTDDGELDGRHRTVRRNSIDDPKAGQKSGYPAKESADALNPLNSHHKAPVKPQFDDHGRPISSPSAMVPLGEDNSFRYIPSNHQASAQPAQANNYGGAGGFGSDGNTAGGQHRKEAAPLPPPPAPPLYDPRPSAPSLPSSTGDRPPPYEAANSHSSADGMNF